MRWRVHISHGLVAAGAGLLAAAGLMTIDSVATQARLAERLAELTRPGRGGAIRFAASTRTAALEHGLVGRIVVPRIGLDAMVVEGAGARALGRGVGHIPATAFPGEPGNAGLAGHRDTFFRRLGRIRTGDLVRLETPDGEFSYWVDSILVVDPDRVDLLEPTRDPTVTLVTCHPFDWVGPAPHRFVVRATSRRPLRQWASASPGPTDLRIGTPGAAGPIAAAAGPR